MSGDYSRFSFDPRKRFAGVLMQQGRVQLDSDWNEQVDMLRERTRLLTLDSGGAVWLPWAITPDAFLIGAPAGTPPDFTIGEGRIYVDGRLAEVFPGENPTYQTQPFLPEPELYDPAVDTIVYLDLWEREVSWAEDTDLLEVALGGVDTTTRIQQVWQVKLVAPPQGPASCGIDLDALFPPSAGRLTTSAVAPPAPDDPCILPPNAGYRGIENRLYRIEVQVGGPLGTALFKWSRDDGSIVSRVSAIAIAGGQSRITVNRIGRDRTLRFSIGDWVTLTDDHRELNGEAGQMARVVDIDEANRVITLDRAVPTAGRAFGASAADLQARNTRLQRWDQSSPLNPLDADGLMTTAAGPIELEDGVQVSFSTDPAGGDFHIGDYWVFAARTADASVEPLGAAPPRGIRHHYAQLAAIPAGGMPTDCRPPPPAEDGRGCCTFVVAPGEDIQAAIDALPDAGGCVCLRAGLHLVDQPVVIRRDNVTLHGESQGAILFGRRGGALLIVAGADHVRVHDIVFRQGEAAAGQPAVFVQRAQELMIGDCALETQSPGRSIALLAVSSMSVSLRALRIAGFETGIWLSKGCGLVTIADCQMRLAGSETESKGSIAVLATDMESSVTVENNLIDNCVSGIVVNDDPTTLPGSRALLSRAVDNRIGLARNVGNDRAFGIDMAPDSATVAGNQITHPGGNVTGIRVAGDGTQITGNLVASQAQELSVELAIGIGDAQDGKFVAIERVLVKDNIVEGIQHGIAATHAGAVEIIGNFLGTAGAPFGLGIGLASCLDCLVGDNVVVRAPIGILASAGMRNTLRGNRIELGAIGIGIASEDASVIAGNRVLGASQFGVLAASITGRCEIVENHAVNCGGEADTAIGIGAALVFGACHAEANEVTDTGLSPGGKPNAGRALGMVAAFVREAQIQGNRIAYTDLAVRDPAQEDRALLMQGLWEIDVKVGDAALALGWPAQISDNSFAGGGRTALVELRETRLSSTDQLDLYLRFERVLFGQNYCSHVVATDFDVREAATVSLRGRAYTIGTNQVKATNPKYASYHLHDRPGPFIGNISSGATLGRTAANQFPSPESSFNMVM